MNNIPKFMLSFLKIPILKPPFASESLKNDLGLGVLYKRMKKNIHFGQGLETETCGRQKCLTPDSLC